MKTPTVITGVSFKRDEMINFIEAAIGALKGYEAQREVQIEEFMNGTEFHEKYLENLKTSYYDYCKEYNLEELPKFHFDPYKMYNCWIVPHRTTTGGVPYTEYETVSVPIEQTIIDNLLSRAIQYKEVRQEVTKYTETIITFESLEDFWIRLDASLETPEFDRISDRVLFYIKNFVRERWNPYISGTANQVTPVLKYAEADLQRIIIAPDAEYHLDSAVFNQYSGFISGEYELSNFQFINNF